MASESASASLSSDEPTSPLSDTNQFQSDSAIPATARYDATRSPHAATGEASASLSVRHSVQLLNVKSMELLRARDFDTALDKLRQAEELLKQQNHKQSRDYTLLRATTFSNLGLLYRSVNQIRPAYNYTNRALRLEISYTGPGGPINPAATHLNLCAILSQMGRHKSALLHAECALASLYMEMQNLNEAIRQHEINNAESAAAADDNSSFSYDQNVGIRDSLMSLIAISYHNQAVEQEYLRQFRAAQHSFSRAEQFSKKRLGKKSHLTHWCAQSFHNAIKLNPNKFHRSFHDREHELLETDDSPTGAHEKEIPSTPRQHLEEKEFQPLPPTVSYIRPADSLKYRTQKHKPVPLNPFEVVQAIQPRAVRKPKSNAQTNGESSASGLPPLPFAQTLPQSNSADNFYFPPSSINPRTHQPQSFPSLAILQSPNELFYSSSPRFAYRPNTSGGGQIQSNSYQNYSNPQSHNQPQSHPHHPPPHPNQSQSHQSRFSGRPPPMPMAVSMGNSGQLAGNYKGNRNEFHTSGAY